MMMAPRVEAVVMSTDRATSPCAMYVATLEAYMHMSCHTIVAEEAFFSLSFWVLPLQG